MAPKRDRPKKGDPVPLLVEFLILFLARSCGIAVVKENALASSQSNNCNADRTAPPIAWQGLRQLPRGYQKAGGPRQATIAHPRGLRIRLSPTALRLQSSRALCRQDTAERLCRWVRQYSRAERPSTVGRPMRSSTISSERKRNPPA